MGRRSQPDITETEGPPVQAVPDPIISSPYEEPRSHWLYSADGIPTLNPGRRPASYWRKTVATGEAQRKIFAEEHREDLPLVNRLREDVRRWRQVGYRGASQVTRDLLEHWSRSDRERRLFFCQLEAIETLIYLLEMRLPGRTTRTGFQKFEVSDEDLHRLLRGERPEFQFAESATVFPTLVDRPENSSFLPLRRLGCKMATGAGKTVIQATLIAWAFCNRGRNQESREFPNAVLVCCPNLTVKERLQVLRPEVEGNYFDLFDLVPSKYRHFLNAGKVLVTNWHVFAPKSPNREGDASYRVVDKGPETNEAFAIDRLGDLASRLPILVFNDEGHHCWRPKADPEAAGPLKGLSAEEKERLEHEREEARVWLDGLDRINSAGLLGDGRPCIAACVDLSATPFYLGASGHPEGSPFPWLVSDFGLVDAIESGIVKIPRLPVRDDTESKDEAGRPDPKYYRLWKHITESIPAAEKGQNKRPKPAAVYREAEGALRTLADQWKARFDMIRSSAPDANIPPVMIVVCDNTEIAEVFFRKLSGERVEEVPAEKGGKTVERTVYEGSQILPELSNGPDVRRTIQIDTRMLDKLDAGEAGSREEAAKQLRHVIATVGKKGQPGEQVRCVVSVSMLTEGWDANNVTHVLGVRAFGSQLLCEQVVGRGLRRINYKPDPVDGKLPAEYVDVYGIPFTLVPFKGRPKDTEAPVDKPVWPIFAVPDKASYEIRFPQVSSYVYALRQEGIVCDVDKLEGFIVDEEPTAVYLSSARGYGEGGLAIVTGDFVKQDRKAYYESTAFQTILFRLTQMIVDDLVHGARAEGDRRAEIKLQAKHLLFPQVYRIVSEYVEKKVEFGHGGRVVDKRELGLEMYAQLLVQRVRDGILPAVAAADAPLLPVLDSFRPWLSTKTVDYQTTRDTVPLTRSHLNRAVVIKGWERRAIEILEAADCVDFFSPNDARVGLTIPYEYGDSFHTYIPDFMVRVRGGATVIVEIKGGGGEIWAPDQIRAKNVAALKWVAAVNNLGTYGKWAFEICRELSRLEGQIAQHAAGEKPLPFYRIDEPRDEERFTACVPLVELRPAAGLFSEEQIVRATNPDWADDWVRPSTQRPLKRGMFVAQVMGKSMEPDIPDGAYCLFGPAPEGARQGRTVLAWLEGETDPEQGGHATIKRYESEKAADPDGGFRHVRITLKPRNPDFKPIVLTPESEGQVRILAELVEVLT